MCPKCTKKIELDRQFFDLLPTTSKFRWPIYYILDQSFCAFWIQQTPIGLISAEIGAVCCIPGHARQHLFHPLCWKIVFAMLVWDSWHLSLEASFFPQKMWIPHICSINSNTGYQFWLICIRCMWFHFRIGQNGIHCSCIGALITWSQTASVMSLPLPIRHL